MPIIGNSISEKLRWQYANRRLWGNLGHVEIWRTLSNLDSTLPFGEKTLDAAARVLHHRAYTAPPGYTQSSIRQPRLDPGETMLHSGGRTFVNPEETGFRDHKGPIMSAFRTPGHTRRQFLKEAGGAGLALAFPTIVPSSVLGANAPSNRVVVGMIGTGRQGTQVNLRTLVGMDGVQVAAVCDVDAWRMGKAKDAVDVAYGNHDCRTHRDWREVIAREDIDAVMNSTPDHWHVPISLAAVRAGKHVSCEKPLTLSIGEGRVLADAARERGVVFRTDSECRSHAYMHKTAELVRNGYIGRIRRFEIGVPRGDQAGGRGAPMEVPSELDYDMWLGPAAVKPYTVDAVHPPQSYGRPGWMRCRDTCEGMVTNWGTHVIDVAQLVNDSERTGPVSVEGSGAYPTPGSGIWNVLIDFKVQFAYADGVTMDYLIDPEGAYLRVEGDEGWIQANWHRQGGFQASDIRILRTRLKEDDLRIPQRSDKGDFIHCIQNGTPEASMADAEVGHRTCSMGQLAHIAIQRGRKLEWDPDRERFPSDDEGNRMLRKPYRAPWGLDIDIPGGAG